MAEDAIFINGPDGLIEMGAAGYETESRLQALLEQHPALLGGGQMTPEEPRRFLLVGREVGVPDREGGSGRWSLDHLFVDQDAIPTFVEVKKAANTEIRRAIVGQMLDYAANGSRYWPIEDLRASFESAQARRGCDADEVLADLVGPDRVEGFWDEVAEHLAEGRIRLVFVADRIPHELRRIVEFLNEKTTTVDVLAVEVAQYQGGGQQCWVPRVIGATAAAADKRPRRVDFETLLANASAEVREAEQHLTAWAKAHGLVCNQTQAARQFSTADGTGLLQFYPKANAIEFWIESRRRTHPEVADRTFEAIRRFTGQSPAAKQPWVRCTQAAPRWEEFERDVLDPYVAGIASA